MSRFRKVVMVEAFNSGSECVMIEADGWKNNIPLWIAAIPIIGTLAIIIYYIIRHREVYYDEVKS